MGVLKHIIPRPARSEVITFIDNVLPAGFVRDNFANTISVSGAALVTTGALIDGKTGLLLRAIGEAADDIDGDFARALNIDSEFGALLDPVLDKFKMTAEIWTLWKHTTNFELPEQRKRRLALGIIAGKHLVNAGLNVAAQLSGLEPHSSNAGKINLWVDGIAIAAFGASDVCEAPEMHDRLANIGYTATAVGVLTGGAAIAGYIGQFRTPQVTAE